MIHPSACCDSSELGSNTRIGALCRIHATARIGGDCEIDAGVHIEGDVEVGNRVSIGSGAFLGSGARLGDGVHIGAHATLGDRTASALIWVQHGAVIGANATLVPGISVGTGAIVRPGTVVLRSVPPHAIVSGNPAQIIGYTTTTPVIPQPAASAAPTAVAARVRGVELLRLTHAIDLRGSLVAAQVGRELPFTPQRCFFVYAVPNAEIRGEHAHRRCAQVLICVHGGISALVDDGQQRAEFRLDRPDIGLLVPPMIWGTQYRYSADAVLLVLASEPYDAADYIRDYAEFQAELAAS